MMVISISLSRENMAKPRNAFFALACLLTGLSACGDGGGTNEGACVIDGPVDAIRQDGSLVLVASQVLLLGKGSCTFPRICVTNQASLLVRDSTTLLLKGDNRTVIAARGIGPEDIDPIVINLEANGAAELYLLIDNQDASVNLVLDAPNSSAWIATTGQAGLVVDGTGAATTTYGWDATNPPPCE
jgi:hypothetical protein